MLTFKAFLFSLIVSECPCLVASGRLEKEDGVWLKGKPCSETRKKGELPIPFCECVTANPQTVSV